MKGRSRQPAAQTIVAQRIDTLIRDQGRSVRGVSREAGLGDDTVRMMLRGRSRSPGGDTLLALAGVLGCSVQYLLGQDGDDEADPAPRESARLDRIERKLDALMKHLGIRMEPQ